MSKGAYQIDVDLDVFKALTAMIAEEGMTHNDALRHLLSLDSVTVPDEPENAFGRLADQFGKPLGITGFYSRGLSLPNGTELRARYKGDLYTARIEDGRWFDLTGLEFSSPSAAATAITGTSVNGWRFWEALRPGDRGWRRLDVLSAR